MRTHEDFESRARSAREHALDEIDVEIEAGDAKEESARSAKGFPGWRLSVLVKCVLAYHLVATSKVDRRIG